MSKRPRLPARHRHLVHSLIALLFAIGALFMAGASVLRTEEARQPERTTAITPNRSVTAKTYMIAAAHPLAAEAGRSVLARGGTAADAAVAVQMVLNLVEPQSSGIGGGAFALYWDADKRELSSWDGRETAPMAAGADYWLGPDGAPVDWSQAVAGGRSVGVPGTLKLIETLQRKYGNRPWAELLAPAIALAEHGFAVSPRMAASIAEAAEHRLTDFGAARRYFFLPSGAPLPAGHLLKNPEFAETLRLIAREGSAPFYHGEIASRIVDATNGAENPGLLSLQDFRSYRVIQRAPVCAPYREYSICGMGPPSSGGLTVGQIMMMLAPFDLAALGPGARSYHLFAEAMKLAFADRGLYMADSDFVPMPIGLLNRKYMGDRSRLIDRGRAMQKAGPGQPPWDEARDWAPDLQPERPGTSHFVIVDSHGDMISMTTTIETGFGSRLMVGGFLLNNELTDFSFVSAVDGKPVANRVEGGKRPRSSMAPTIVFRDEMPVLLTGSPGGSRIIAYVAQSLVALLDWRMDPQAAIDLGHVVNRGGITELEEESDAADLAESLAAMGHEVKIRNLNSGLHVIRIGQDGLTGAADSRREGRVLGD